MNKKNIIMVLSHLFLLVLTVLLFYGSLGFANAGATAEDVSEISTMHVVIDGSPAHAVSLPYNFTGLEGRTPVTLTATIYPQSDDVVYIKSIYAPAKIYLDGKLAYVFGKPENYPAFMKDPATEVHLVETHGTGDPMELRMEFFSPLSRSTLTIHPPMVGTSKEIILERFHVLGIPCILAMAQIIYGLSLVLISICLQIVDKKSQSFLWLGLLSLMTGFWSFGENNFTGIVLKNATFLYLLSFIGFFTFVIPLLKFARAVVDYEHPFPIWCMELSMVLASGIALLLQLLGIVPFCSSMFFFHIALPVVLIVLTGLTAWEFIRYRNNIALRFILPLGILTLSGVLELLNYRLSITYVFSSLFQFGILFFLLVMGITAGMAVKDSMDLKARKKELSFEKELMDIQIKEQQSHSQLLSQHEELLRQQRHDLRHHLAAIQEFTKDFDSPRLQAYLQALVDNIPTSGKGFCENPAVNAILSHYDAICSQKGIRLTLHLAVPKTAPGLVTSNLCIIFGNLLENAVEACDRMQQGEKFIRLNTSIHLDLLTITMDNSFDGSIQKEGEQFLSSKRNSPGIGLSSIRSVAQKAGGDVEFRHEGNVFYSSVYVKL